MKHTKQEIIKALTIIKEECEETENCRFCPFYSDLKRNCIFSSYRPSDFAIAEPDEHCWRAAD